MENLPAFDWIGPIARVLAIPPPPVLWGHFLKKNTTVCVFNVHTERSPLLYCLLQLLLSSAMPLSRLAFSHRNEALTSLGALEVRSTHMRGVKQPAFRHKPSPRTLPFHFPCRPLFPPPVSTTAWLLPLLARLVDLSFF